MFNSLSGTAGVRLTISALAISLQQRPPAVWVVGLTDLATVVGVHGRITVPLPWSRSLSAALLLSHVSFTKPPLLQESMLSLVDLVERKVPVKRKMGAANSFRSLYQ